MVPSLSKKKVKDLEFLKAVLQIDLAFVLLKIGELNKFIVYEDALQRSVVDISVHSLISRESFY